MSRSKGNRIVRERAIPFYENLGYTVEKVEHIGRFSKSQDLFSTVLDGDYTDAGFDLICIKKNLILLVQVKTNSPPTRKWYKDFADKYAGENVRVHCLTWYDRDGIRLQTYDHNKTLKELDLRKSRNKDAKRTIWFDTEYIQKSGIFPDL